MPLIWTKTRSVMWSTTSCASFSWTLLGHRRTRLKKWGLCFWQNARCTQACRFSTFLGKGFSSPLTLRGFSTRLCRFSISGWLSQAVKSTNTYIKNIASGALDTSKKLTSFLKIATCRCKHLRCRRISVFQIAIKLLKKFWVICRSSSCVCGFIQLIITVNSVPVHIFFAVVIVIIFILNNLWIRVIPWNCIFNARSGVGSSRQTDATIASDFLAWASLAACAASSHCVQKGFYKIWKIPTFANAFTLSACRATRG